jgi:hypothetical protein
MLLLPGVSDASANSPFEQKGVLEIKEFQSSASNAKSASYDRTQ